jgi:hypothetical protein
MMPKQIVITTTTTIHPGSSPNELFCPTIAFVGATGAVRFVNRRNATVSEDTAVEHARDIAITLENVIRMWLDNHRYIEER